MLNAIYLNFLGNAPKWYKRAIIGFLLANPLLLRLAGPVATGWVLIAEFIFALAMALKCYPLAPGGFLAVEAVLLGMTSPAAVYDEVVLNLPVILLLMFMVAGIHFMKEVLQYAFTKVVLAVRSKVILSLVFCVAGAFLSAFLDALTVTAVLIAVANGFYGVYHRFVSEKRGASGSGCCLDELVATCCPDDLVNFRGFLRNLLMHAAVGTTLGGVTTLIGEPQNLLIGNIMHWDFGEFFVRTAPVSIPVLLTGLLTCAGLERFRRWGYGYQLPETVRQVLADHIAAEEQSLSKKAKMRFLAQGIAFCFLVVALAFHVAEPGIIGLCLIIFLTAMNGVTEEKQIGRAFEDALPFTALLVVFFAIVSVIHSQHLFDPMIQTVVSLEGRKQLMAYYLASGLLSTISDNVFVAAIYITETAKAFADGRISRANFDLMAVAINTGTNIPSVATPNGQAAFLFLLTSSIAPLVRLSYTQMVRLALPYTLSMTTVGLVAIAFLHPWG